MTNKTDSTEVVRDDEKKDNNLVDNDDNFISNGSDFSGIKVVNQGILSLAGINDEINRISSSIKNNPRSESSSLPQPVSFDNSDGSNDSNGSNSNQFGPHVVEKAFDGYNVGFMAYTTREPTKSKRSGVESYFAFIPKLEPGVSSTKHPKKADEYCEHEWLKKNLLYNQSIDKNKAFTKYRHSLYNQYTKDEIIERAEMFRKLLISSLVYAHIKIKHLQNKDRKGSKTSIWYRVIGFFIRLWNVIKMIFTFRWCAKKKDTGIKLETSVKLGYSKCKNKLSNEEIESEIAVNNGTLDLLLNNHVLQYTVSHHA